MMKKKMAKNTELKNNNNFNSDFATTLLPKRLYYGGASSKN